MTIVVTDLASSHTTGATTLAVSSITVPVNSLCVVAVQEFSGGSTVAGALSDGVNSFTLAGSETDSSQTITMIFFHYYAAGLSAGTLTYTMHTSGAAACMTAFYAVGTVATSIQDNSVTASLLTASANPPVISMTTGAAVSYGDLLVAAVGGRANGTSYAYNQDTADGWASPPDSVNFSSSANDCVLAGGFLVNTGLGHKTFNPTISAGNGSSTLTVIIVGFIAVPAPGAPSPAAAGFSGMSNIVRTVESIGY